MIEPITKKIENEPLLTATINLFDVQIDPHSIKDEALRNKAANKLNKIFDRIEVLPLLKEDTQQIHEYCR